MRNRTYRSTTTKQAAEVKLSQIEQILDKGMAPVHCAHLILKVLNGVAVHGAGMPVDHIAVELAAANAAQKLALMKEVAQRKSGASFFVLCCMRIAFPAEAKVVFADYKARKAA
ncbi:hypothetical protein [Geomonas propionica]|uniref:Uncharacterized protein n=1 Tax=Geomonas propionica TaxID=2798582 RepID=A0ABS0YL69_9BACT|nr:hypothetical protein [Geomonas propionica]MBJ6798636.1 hypothetical protein [Geomonas propionica]